MLPHGCQLPDVAGTREGLQAHNTHYVRIRSLARVAEGPLIRTQMLCDQVDPGTLAWLEKQRKASQNILTLSTQRVRIVLTVPLTPLIRTAHQRGFFMSL